MLEESQVKVPSEGFQSEKFRVDDFKKRFEVHKCSKQTSNPKVSKKSQVKVLSQDSKFKAVFPHGLIYLVEHDLWSESDFSYPGGSIEETLKSYSYLTSSFTLGRGGKTIGQLQDMTHAEPELCKVPAQLANITDGPS